MCVFLIRSNLFMATGSLHQISGRERKHKIKLEEEIMEVVERKFRDQNFSNGWQSEMTWAFLAFACGSKLIDWRYRNGVSNGSLPKREVLPLPVRYERLSFCHIPHSTKHEITRGGDYTATGVVGATSSGSSSLSGLLWWLEPTARQILAKTTAPPGVKCAFLAAALDAMAWPSWRQDFETPGT